jgi:hypothetical protein
MISLDPQLIDNHEHSKTRGIIVMDTSSLLPLVVPYGDGSGNHYTRLLDYLSKNGYEIHIPELVAFEASRMLRNGTHTNYFFGKPASSDKAVYKKAYQFLHDVARGDYPNIHIVPTPDALLAPSQGAALMRELWQAYNDNSMRKGRELCIQLDGMKGKHAGEIAAVEYIHSIHPDQPIFFLSNTRTVSNEVVHYEQSEHRRVSRLNVSGLLEGLRHKRLLRHIGLTHDRSAEQIGDDIVAQLKKCGLTDALPLPAPIDCSYYGDQSNNYPFIHSLHGLNRKPALPGSATNGSSPEAAENGSAASGVSQMDRFKARYGGDWRAAAARNRNGSHSSEEPKR